MGILGLILAGGESRRMGEDKALVTLKGRPLIAHVIDRLAPQVAALAISANGDPARFAAFALPVLPDDSPRGPLSGLLAGMRHAQALGLSAVLTAPCDGPVFPADLAARLAAFPGGALAETPRDQHPTWGLWPLAEAERLAAFLASGAKPRLRDFGAAAGRARWPEGSFVNVNTPADLATLAAR